MNVPQALATRARTVGARRWAVVSRFDFIRGHVCLGLHADALRLTAHTRLVNARAVVFGANVLDGLFLGGLGLGLWCGRGCVVGLRAKACAGQSGGGKQEQGGVFHGFIVWGSAFNFRPPVIYHACLIPQDSLQDSKCHMFLF